MRAVLLAFSAARRNARPTLSAKLFFFGRMPFMVRAPTGWAPLQSYHALPGHQLLGGKESGSCPKRARNVEVHRLLGRCARLVSRERQRA